MKTIHALLLVLFTLLAICLSFLGYFNHNMACFFVGAVLTFIITFICIIQTNSK